MAVRSPSNAFPVERHFVLRHWKFVAFLIALALLAVASLVFPDTAETTGGSAMLLAYLTTAAVVLSKARHKSGQDRRAWLLIGTGMLSAGVGVTIVAVLETMQVAVPAFGPIDLFFLTAYGTILAGTVSLPNAFRGQREVVRILIDGVVGAIAFGTLLWIFVIGDLIHYFADASSWDRWLGTAFPLLDVLTIVVFITILSRRNRYRMDPRLVLMAGGALIQAMSDLTYLTGGIETQFVDAQPTYALFIAGAALLSTAGYMSDYVPRIHEFAPRVMHVVGTAAPYGIAFALVVATLLSLPNAGFDQTTRLLIAATIGVGTLVVFRQALAIRDNRIHVDQKRTDLVASVSHELRTPLTAVVGVLALLSDSQNRPAGEEMDELVALAHHEADRMSRIVADVTLLTRIEPGDMVFAEAPTRVARLVAETLQIIDVRESVVDLAVDSELEAKIDRGRVQQVLVNLIENAVRYGHGAIQVRAYASISDLIIEVHDDGPGVPKRERTVIWERFERGAHRFDAAIPGSGIGLAVVSAIAAGHGGTASYRDSERLGGACFSVDLPGRVMERSTVPSTHRAVDGPQPEVDEPVPVAGIATVVPNG